jgi:hypothetical protein
MRVPGSFNFIQRPLGAVAILLVALLGAAAQEPMHSNPLQHSRGPAIKHSADATARTASSIEFDNAIEASKIKFTLTNSVSQQRYSIETMVGGVRYSTVGQTSSSPMARLFLDRLPEIDRKTKSHSGPVFRPPLPLC